MYGPPMLHEFLTANRVDLIARCRFKVARRRKPSQIPSAAAHGIPLFLQQLADTLRREESAPAPGPDSSQPPPVQPEISRAASLHGVELLRLGYSIDQVVRDYGDVCQAVTELAVEKRVDINASEFRTLNRCLDDAIADAVSAFGGASQASANDSVEALHSHLNAYSEEQRRLVDIAIHSYDAIKTGSVGLTGATGTLLMHTLTEMHALADRALPEIRLAYTKTAFAVK
jgi:hypothetical protein